MLLRSMRQYFITDILISIVICICGFFLLFSGLNAQPTPTYFPMFAGGLLMFTGLMSANQTVRYYLNEELMAYRILLLDTDRIVWLYYSKLNLMPYGVGVLNRCHFFVCTIDGKIYTLKASEASIKKNMQQATKENPDIVTGYSVDREQLFKVDPRLLKND